MSRTKYIIAGLLGLVALVPVAYAVTPEPTPVQPIAAPEELSVDPVAVTGMNPDLKEIQAQAPPPARQVIRETAPPTLPSGIPDVAAILARPITHWTAFNTDPFNRDPEVAKQRPIRERAFREMGLLGSCLEEALNVTDAPGSKGTLKKGDRLLVSESGSGPHWNQEIAFPPVPGYSGVGYVLDTEEWTLSKSCGGLLIERPEVCNNWALALPPIVQAPPVVATACPTIRVTTHLGDDALKFKRSAAVESATCPFVYYAPGDPTPHQMPTDCPAGINPCDFGAVIELTGISGPQGGIDVVDKPGVYLFQVSTEFADDPNALYVFCMERSINLEAREKGDPPPAPSAPPEPLISMNDIMNDLGVIGSAHAAEMPSASTPLAAYPQEYQDTYNAWWKRVNSERRTCGVEVRSTDYHDGTATLFYAQGDIPSSWSFLELYWGFPETGECKTY